MGERYTEWLSTDVYVRRGGWFLNWCLIEHYDIPRSATEIRFVRGKNPDALHHKVNESSIHVVTGHYLGYLDGSRGMMWRFTNWFGPKSGWVSVEWR